MKARHGELHWKVQYYQTSRFLETYIIRTAEGEQGSKTNLSESIAVECRVPKNSSIPHWQTTWIPWLHPCIQPNIYEIRGRGRQQKYRNTPWPCWGNSQLFGCHLGSLDHNLLKWLTTTLWSLMLNNGVLYNFHLGFKWFIAPLSLPPVSTCFNKNGSATMGSSQEILRKTCPTFDPRRGLLGSTGNSWKRWKPQRGPKFSKIVLIQWQNDILYKVGPYQSLGL